MLFKHYIGSIQDINTDGEKLHHLFASVGQKESWSGEREQTKEVEKDLLQNGSTISE